MQTRRDFLKMAALFSGTAGLSGVFPESVQRAFAIDPAPGSSYLDAEHIVILMQENRSFDHTFGALQGVRGFNDPRAIKLPDGNLVWVQTNAAGETYAPFRLNIKDTDATWLSCLPHSRESQVDAWNRGNYDRWLEAKRSQHHKEYADLPLTLGHYTREDISFYYALADAFTVCDQNFSSVMTSTTPNRLEFWTGTIREQQNENSQANIRNGNMTFGGARWHTFPEHLEENGISWKFYQNDLKAGGGVTEEQRIWLTNFGCNPLECFAQYNVKLSPRYVENLPEEIASLSDEVKSLEAQASLQSSNPAQRNKIQKKLAKKMEALDSLKKDQELGRDGFAKLTQAAKNLYQKAFTINAADPDYHELATLSYHDGQTERQLKVPKGDALYQFRNDVQNGRLPVVSWLAAPEMLSDHPVAPWYGMWYVSEIMDILTQDPEVWKKTIFILTYDENDGYFDHVPPFVAPNPRKRETGHASAGIDTGVEFVQLEQELQQGVPEREAREGPIGLGYRVPMIVASPWSRGGWVNSQVFDHTSTIRFMEQFLGKKSGRKIEESNISQWRRTVSGDLTTIFRPFQGEKIAPLPFVQRDPFVETIHKAQFKGAPSGYKKLSGEEIESINRNPLASTLIPHQERGIRPSCALPYQLYADGALSRNRRSFDMRLKAGNEVFGEQAAGAPFNIYAYGTKRPADGAKGAELRLGNMRSASYAVAPGDSLRESWLIDAFVNQTYRLAVHGPNGFFREFIGDANDPAISVNCGYQPGNAVGREKLTGNIDLSIVNAGGSLSCEVEIVDNSYRAKPIKKLIEASNGKAVVVLNLEKSFGWYDFSVKVAGFDRFEMRYAGHVETGQTSRTDPLMGAMFV